MGFFLGRFAALCALASLREFLFFSTPSRYPPAADAKIARPQLNPYGGFLATPTSRGPTLAPLSTKGLLSSILPSSSLVSCSLRRGWPVNPSRWNSTFKIPNSPFRLPAAPSGTNILRLDDHYGAMAGFAGEKIIPRCDRQKTQVWGIIADHYTYGASDCLQQKMPLTSHKIDTH